MAFIQMSLMSDALARTVQVNVILPADKLQFPGALRRPESPYKTLYLLHGVLGSSVDWVLGTRIQRFAEENDLAVVMPSGDNAFYVDQPAGQNYYGRFTGEELVELTRRMFPLSRRRDDTFIGGLSMGGYGALRNGLKYADTFSHIVCLSGAFIMDEVPDRTNDSPVFMERRDYAEAVFGDLDQVLESDKNPKWLVRQLEKERKDIPKIYLACGTEDSLLGRNRDMRDFLKEHGADVTYEEGPGGHEWDFWDAYIKKAIYEWLPTESSGQGRNSGNVGI